MTVTAILESIDTTNYKFISSPFYDWAHAPATSKGKIGEDIAQSILEAYDCKVTPRTSKEHDRVVDGKKVEIKTAMLKKDSDEYSFYGYDASEDPHYWLYQFVSPESITLIKMDRNSMGNVYLGKTRKNTMFTITPEEMIQKGGEVVAEYIV